MDNSVPVVVLKDKGGAVTLAVARSLGRLGIPTYLVSPAGSSPMSASRYWVKRFTWDFASSHDQLLPLLLDIGRQLGSRPILLSATDWAALFVENNATALQERFIFPKPAPQIIRVLTNKWQMFLAAKEHGIPTPEVMYPQSRDDAVRFLESARFPIVLKGVDRLLPHYKWMKIVHTERDLIETYDRAADSGAPNLLLQEYIPGDDESVWMCNAYFGAGSECRAIFTGRKLRQLPPHRGIATLAVCLANETVENATRNFMQAVGYQGLVGVGHRYDARDGVYKVLDVNPRVSGVFRLFRATNGMDVVRVCYLDLTGQPIPATALTIGRKWMLESDIFTAVAYAREGNLTFMQWLKSLRGIQELHWFAADDLTPSLSWSWNLLRGILGRGMRRVISVTRSIAVFWKPRTRTLAAADADAALADVLGDDFGGGETSTRR